MDKQQFKTVSKVVGKIVLAAAATAGVITLLAVMPGLPMALSPLLGKNKWRDRENYYKKYTKKIIKRLEKRGMVKILERKGETMLAITKLGKAQLDKWQLGDLKIDKSKKWDGKWRIVIFDIPEKMRRHRDEVREQLKELEFYYLQNSVWVYPYPCEEIVQSIAKAFDLLPYMIYIEADYLGNDKYLRQAFNV